jgi:chromosome partitioning protein
MARKTDIIAVTNQKGGVGKSTTAINLAAILSDPIYSADVDGDILLCDLDPSGNATAVFSDKDPDEIDRKETMFYQFIQAVNENLVDMDFMQKQKLEELVLPTARKRLKIIPTGLVLEEVNLELASYRHRVSVLKKIFDRESDYLSRFRYIILDTPPSMSLIFFNSLIAAQHLLVPLQAKKLALLGLKSLLKTLSKCKKLYNAEADVLGVFLTFFETNVNTSNAARESMMLNCPNIFWDDIAIRKNISLDEAHGEAQAIIDYKPNCQGSKDYIKLANKVLELTNK